MNGTAVARGGFSLERAGVREIFAIVLLAWAVPVLVHLIPWQGARPIGVYLLPAFWTAFAALYFYGVTWGLVAALVTPAVNLLTTGLPGWERVGSMTLELVAYVLCAAAMLRRWPRFWLVAPLAYLPAKALAILVLWLVPAFAYARNPWEHWLASVQNGVAGLAVLTAINVGVGLAGGRRR